MISAAPAEDIARSIAIDPIEPMVAGRDCGLDMLYVRHWGELCRYIKKHFGSGPPDPEDVVQETFIKYVGVKHREAIDNPRAYLFRTAHNVLIDERRRLAVRQADAGQSQERSQSDDRTPERVLVGQERLQVLTGALRAMPAQRRRSLLLNRLQGLSAAAIARMTGYSESAVKKHIEVALAELELALAEVECGAG
jgi:RNA polymerase sigma factor (sigma-70 family)